MPRSWLRRGMIVFMIGWGLAALPGPAVRAQSLYPGAGYPSPAGNAQLVQILLTALSPERRAEAARLLGVSGDLKAIEALSSAAVNDQDARVRQAASDAIAQIRGGNGVGVLPGPPVSTWPPVYQPGPPVYLQPGPPAFPTGPPVDPYVEMVQSWYQRYLHRTSDLAGLQVWVMYLRRGQSPEQAQAGILGSPEYYQRNGNNPVGFINGLFADVIGRGASPQEIQFWLNRFQRYRGDRQRLAADFMRECQPMLANRPGYGFYHGP
jgi:hypothetical protein